MLTPGRSNRVRLLLAACGVYLLLPPESKPRLCFKARASCRALALSYHHRANPSHLDAQEISEPAPDAFPLHRAARNRSEFLRGGGVLTPARAVRQMLGLPLPVLGVFAILPNLGASSHEERSRS